MRVLPLVGTMLYSVLDAQLFVLASYLKGDTVSNIQECYSPIHMRVLCVWE